MVVVPWDYDPGCEPTYWSRSARWIDSGLVGFYTLKLRSETQWVDAHPTFDAFTADLNPYPHGEFYRAGYRGTNALRSGVSLDARELFSLFRVLPFYDASDRVSPDALVPLRAWLAEHPELAKRYPADVMVRYFMTASAPR